MAAEVAVEVAAIDNARTGATPASGLCEQLSKPIFPDMIGP